MPLDLPDGLALWFSGNSVKRVGSPRERRQQVGEIVEFPRNSTRAPSSLFGEYVRRESLVEKNDVFVVNTSLFVRFFCGKVRGKRQTSFTEKRRIFKSSLARAYMYLAYIVFSIYYSRPKNACNRLKIKGIFLARRTAYLPPPYGLPPRERTAYLPPSRELSTGSSVQSTSQKVYRLTPRG